MKILCGDSILDFDQINDYKPDHKNIICQCEVGSYATHAITEQEYGMFVKTDDNGLLYFSDIVFKMLIDMAVAAQLSAVKYLMKEIERAINSSEDKDSSLRRPDPKKPFGMMLAESNIKNILIGNDNRISAHNLKAMTEASVVNMLCTGSEYYTDEYNTASVELLEYITDYVYIGGDVKSFMQLHAALVDVFSTFSTVDFKDFIENFYKHLDKFPEIKYTEITAGKSADEDEKIADNSTVNNEAEEGNNKPEADNSNAKIYSRKLKRIKASDITGLDETYGAAYCEGLYEKELMNADSEGFLNKMIIARANEKSAPIDLLSEAISREHSKNTNANWLRLKIAEVQQNIAETVDSSNTTEGE